jgi:para-nitrobenzyl esterase
MKKTEIIETKSGKVQGYVEDGVKIFKGIPFAEPPIGDLRFSPPLEKKPWKDIFDATEYGPYTLQGYTPLEDLLGKLEPQSEDCLTLNIWTPATDNRKRPVMVWIHGGAYITGGGATPIYDGSNLAKRGDVVIVTINYRLGALGFLYIPGITANVGMLDQIVALKWIKDNIDAFGGDPNNITIFGESAGGISVITLIAIPAAKGLFHRAISQSAPILDLNPTAKSTKDLMRELNIQEGDIEALRNIPANKIIDAQNKILAEALNKGESEVMGFRPSIDGDSIPTHPLEAIRQGAAKNIELIIGCTQDEGKLFTKFNPLLKNLKDDRLELAVSGLLKSLNISDKANFLIESYQNAREGKLPTKPMDILDAIWTDYIFRIFEIRVAETQRKHQPNTYFYIFTWPSPMFQGASHAVELPFAFGTIGGPELAMFFGKGEDAKILSEKMMDAWIAFAHSGNPNNKNIPTWPSYDSDKRSTMFIGKEFKMVEKPFEEEREAWEGLLEFM